VPERLAASRVEGLMSSWKKVRNLFWQSGGAAPDQGELSGAELSDHEFAELLSTSPAVPSAEGLPELTPNAVTALEVNPAEIDFQAQYDLAGIPNTDEVEQLEGFLSRLDDALPQASKLAAAQAFLGAIGKSKDEVLRDATRKLQHVRVLAAHKQEQTELEIREQQDSVEALQKQIEEHRKQMEALLREQESVRAACRAEETRLQAARVFFGNIEPSPHP
jgi:hypothetical protein